MTTILGTGAEATVTLDNDVVVKDRSPKRYRHPQLDAQLREARTKREVKVLGTAGALVAVPKVFDATASAIRMEHIAGPQVKEVLDGRIELVETIGRLLARLHAKNIIHGDLTTSNMIVRHREGDVHGTDRHRAVRSENTQEGHRHVTFASHSSTKSTALSAGRNAARSAKERGDHHHVTLAPLSSANTGATPDGASPGASHSKTHPDARIGDGGGGRDDSSASEIVLIDFGLAFTSTRAEDKAVDLHLFRQALESRHHRIYEQAYKLFLKSYKAEYAKLDEQQCAAVLERLKQVELRGRNKAKY